MSRERAARIQEGEQRRKRGRTWSEEQPRALRGLGCARSEVQDYTVAWKSESYGLYEDALAGFVCKVGSKTLARQERVETDRAQIL